MYPKDEYGNYKIDAFWIEAWEGGGPYIAGFCLKELRNYEDGTLRVKSLDSKYLHDFPDKSFAHSIYIRSMRELKNSYENFIK